MKITTKGQVTIPADIREKAGLLPGTDVEFQVGPGGKVFIRKIASKRRRGVSLIERMRAAGSVKMTTDQIMALTRGEP